MKFWIMNYKYNYSESTYAGSGYQLAVVKLDTLEIVTSLQQVLKARVCY